MDHGREAGGGRGRRGWGGQRRESGGAVGGRLFGGRGRWGRWRGGEWTGKGDGAGQLAEDNWCYKSELKIRRAYQKRCCQPPTTPQRDTVGLFFPSRHHGPLADSRGKTAFGLISCGSHPLYPCAGYFDVCRPLFGCVERAESKPSIFPCSIACSVPHLPSFLPPSPPSPRRTPFLLFSRGPPLVTRGLVLQVSFLVDVIHISRYITPTTVLSVSTSKDGMEHSELCIGYTGH